MRAASTKACRPRRPKTPAVMSTAAASATPSHLPPTPRPSACRIRLRDRDACEGELDSVTIEVALSASPDSRESVSSGPSVLKPVQEAEAKATAGRRGGTDDPQQQLQKDVSMRLALKTSDPVRARSLRRMLIALLVATVATALTIGGIAVSNAVNQPELRIRGIPSNGVLNAAALSEATLTVDTVETVGSSVDQELHSEALRNVEARLNGEIVPTLWVGNHRVIDLGALRDGEYEVTVTTDLGLLWNEISLSRRFIVDTTES